MSTLKKLPGWVPRINEMSDHFTEAGLHGLLDNHAFANLLGELLAWGEIKPQELERWLNSNLAAVGRTAYPPERDEQAFWTEAWKEILDRDIEVPPVPKLKRKTIEAITQYDFRLIFLPTITEHDYPSSFLKPNWAGCNLHSIIRRDLPNRWVAIETIAKSNWDDPNGYGHGMDGLARQLGLQSRFNISRDDLKGLHLPKVAKLLGLSARAVRLPSVEEWNLVGNLFRWLNKHRHQAMPNLGGTISREWCEGGFYPWDGLMIGVCDRGLYPPVYYWPKNCASIGFRVLAVL